MDHVKRPKLARTQPIRRWATLLEGATPPNDGGPAPDHASAAGDDATLGDMLSRSVQIGYRVVDEYIRQGQKAAARLGRANPTEGLTSDVQDFNVRLMQHASDLVGVWFDFVDRYMAGALVPRAPARAPAPHATTNGNGTAPAPAAPDDGPVRVQVASPWPTEVTVDLRPGARTARLVAQALRAVEPEKPRLDDVRFEPASADAPPRFHVRVPATQPPGVYHGLLVDSETAVPAGTVSVRVSHDE